MNDAATRREIGIAAVGAVACALVTTAPILFALDNWGIQDWDHHFVLMEVPRASLLEYFQIPLWNPYSEGGMPMLAHPQSRFLSPFFNEPKMRRTLKKLRLLLAQRREAPTQQPTRPIREEHLEQLKTLGYVE